MAGEGDIDIQISLAKDYLAGDNGAPIRPVDAARWLTKAPEKGNAEAQFLLAELLRKARGTERQSEKRSDAVCQRCRQRAYRSRLRAAHGYHYGTGVKKPELKAVTYYEKAADAWPVAAKNNLGLMYLQGKGTDRDLRRFPDVRGYVKAGNSWGQNNLGGMYEMGWGTEKDQAKALNSIRVQPLRETSQGQQTMPGSRPFSQVAAKARLPSRKLQAHQCSSETHLQPMKQPDPDVNNQPAEAQILGGSSTD